MHDFGPSAVRGRAGVDAMFRHLVMLGWTIEREASSREQWDGIDLWARNPEGGLVTIEVKNDERAHDTGRAFVETVSNDTTGRAGWVYSCAADVILYVVPGDGVVYWLDPAKLRSRVSDWLQRADRRDGRFGHVSAPNQGYRTRGVAVPLAELGAVNLTAPR